MVRAARSLVGTIPALPDVLIFLRLAHVHSALIDLIWVARRTEQDTDVEILLLRQHLRILQRKQPHPPRIFRWETLTLLVLASKRTQMSDRARARLGQTGLLFTPATLIQWHRELVRRKWTFRTGAPRGQPSIGPDLNAVILRLAKENPAWGYGKLQGELLNLGDAIGRSTVRDVLKHQRVPPAPECGKQGSSWRTFLSHTREEILACDVFSAETAWLKTIYVLFGIELGSRRVHRAGCTPNPSAVWVTQQARHISWKMQDGAATTRFLIHDRDSTFPAVFATVFMAEDVTRIHTPVQAPNAHAVAERWIRSVREECLNTILIFSEGHLHRVLTA